MEEQFACTRKACDHRDIVARINGSKLRSLGNANRAWLVRMRLILARDYCFRLSDFDLAIGAANQEELRSFCEKFRRAAFVGLDMGMLVTDNAME